MRVKRWLLLAAALGVAILLLFWSGNVFNNHISESDPNQGRHPDEPAPEQKPGIKELTIQVSMAPREFAVLTQLRQQFQIVHSDISIKLDNISSDTAYMSWKKASQLGATPDILLLNNSWVTEFAALGYLFPVGSFLTSEMMSQQMEQAVKQVKWNGYLWGVPKDMDVYVMVYSTKHMAELGMNKPPAQADELMAMHIASNKPDEGKYGLILNMEDPLAFIALTKSLGGQKVQGKTAPVQLTDLSVAKSLESLLFAGAREAGNEDKLGLITTFPAFSSSLWKPWDLLEQGRIAGMLTTLSDYKLHAKEGLVMTGLPLPKGEGIWKSSWLTGRSFVISSRADFPKEAFEWIKELTSVASNVKFWNEGFKLPSSLGGYTLGGIKNDPAVQSVIPFIDNEEGSMKTPQYNKQLQQLEVNLFKLWKGELSWKSLAA